MNDLAEALALVEEAERRLATQRENRWCPHTPTSKQAAFLRLDVDDALYGGAAGGGKSDALLMYALEKADVPGYTALIVRRTYADLALPGAIMDRAAQWLAPTAATWNDRDKTWRFPSGARLTFGYLESENDKYRYQGAEFARIAVDELTQFEESQYRYLRSRLRRREGFEIAPSSRAASNPGGRGHHWVFNRYVAEDSPFPFVPASLNDNPHIDREDYAGRLEDLDEVTRAQLLEGLWVIDTQGLIYPFTSANIVPELPHIPRGFDHYVLGVDLGAREDEPTTAYAVACWHDKIEGVWVAEAFKRSGETPTSIAKEIKRLAAQYGGFRKIVVDHGALGRGYINEFRSRWAIPAEDAEKQSKLGFRKLLRGDIERQRLMLVEPMCQPLIEEAQTLRWDERYPGEREERGASNHCTDALLYAWRACKAFAAEPPETRPAPGSSEALEAEIAAIEEAEDQAGLAKKRSPGKWWQR